jgi:hypothetical protein
VQLDSRYTEGMVPVEVAIERLRNPKPGGKIWEAREYGVDLTLLIDSLRHTPEERLRYAEQVMQDFEELQGAVRRTQCES